MAKKSNRASVEECQAFFPGMSIVNRQEIQKFEETTGKRLAMEIWQARAARGCYHLYPEAAAIVQEPATIEVIHQVPVQTKVLVEQEVITPVHAEMVSREIDVFDRDSQIPKVNPRYIPWGNFKTLDTLVKSQKFFACYITGDTGTGKNAMIEQVCAKNERPVVRLNFTRDTKEEDIVGSKTLIDGNIVYEDGPAIWAAENGAILCLDEISAGDANILMCLQPILEGNEFFVKSLNRMVKPAPGFAIVASDNTKGRGSDSSRIFIGTNVLNEAFLDRFDLMMVQDYPPHKIEMQIMRQAYQHWNPDVDEKFVEDVVNWVQVIRRTYQQEAIDEMISTRRALSVIKSRALWFKPKEAIELCIARFDETTIQAFGVLWDKLQSGEIKKESNGD